MFKEGFDCGQVITMAIADDLNIDRKTALKVHQIWWRTLMQEFVVYIGGLIALGLNIVTVKLMTWLQRENDSKGM